MSRPRGPLEGQGTAAGPSRHPRLGPLAVLLAVGALLLGSFAPAPGLAAPSVLAAPPTLVAEPSFDIPRAQAVLLQPVTFHQGFRDPQPPLRVELLLAGSESWTSDVLPAEVASSGGAYQATATIGDHVLPNTTFHYRFRIVHRDGTSVVGPEATATVQDPRFGWHVLAGPTVRLHWYAGDQAFAQRALRIGEDAIARAAKLLGVTNVPTVDFFVYGDTQAFLQALGPGTRETTAGEFVPEIRTMFADIGPSQIGSDWVGVVIPHELTHLVFALATDNPYHEPPIWLNEGLAVYLSEGGPGPRHPELVQAVQDGTVIPLDGLVQVFPRTSDAFHVAYAEAVSAVDYFIRRYGEPALVSLIRSYAQGLADDDAFRAAAGVTLGKFESSWLREVGVPGPKAYGPRPAPAGPQPAEWAAPTTTVATVASPAPAPPTSAASSPSAPSTDDSHAVGVVLLLGLIGLTVGGALLLSLVMARRGPPDLKP